MSSFVPHSLRRQAGRILLLLGTLGAVAPASADVSDPVGYVAYSIPGGSRRLVGVPLTQASTRASTVSSLKEDRIVLPQPVQASYFGGAATMMVQVRQGANAGLTFTATGFEGNELIVDTPPRTYVFPGDTVTLFPNYNLNTLLGANNTFGLQTGASAEEADTVSLWNAATQISRTFYFQSGGGGWREAGQEAAGNRGDVTINFPAAIMVNRRAATPLNLVVVGVVPMPLDQRYFRVLPGRNLISAPFSAAATVADYGLYDEFYPRFSMFAGPSAPEADTLRLTSAGTANESEVIYYRSGHGWELAGSGGDAAATPVELGQAMDFQRFGPAGFIRANGVPNGEGPLRSIASAPVATVPIQGLQAGSGSLSIRWSGEAGAAYQIQRRTPGGEWQDIGGETVAAEGVTTTTCPATGSGELRIVKK